MNNLKENIRRDRFRVLEKVIKTGYDTDKKIINLKLEELILMESFNRSDLEIVVGIKNALLNKSLIAFLSGLEERKMNNEGK